MCHGNKKIGCVEFGNEFGFLACVLRLPDCRGSDYGLLRKIVNVSVNISFAEQCASLSTQIRVRFPLKT